MADKIIEISREDFDGMTVTQKEVFSKAIEAGSCKIIEEVGLTQKQVKDVVDEAFEPVRKELESLKSQKITQSIDRGDSVGAWVKGLFKTDNGNKMSALSEVEQKAVSTFANYTTSADGGAVVPKDYADRVWELTVTNDGILEQVDIYNISRGNSIQIPVDETTEWDASGITAYWVTEGSAATPTKPVFKTITLQLAKLVLFLPYTEELMEDTNVNLAEYFVKKTAQKMNRELKKATLTVSAGQIISAVDSACRITVQRHTSDTFSYQDAVAMYAHMLPASKEAGTAVWVMSPPAMAALLEMEDAAGHLVFTSLFGSFGVADKPRNTMLGLRVIESGYLHALGTTGDVMLLDFTKMAAAKRGPRSDMSIHFAFDQDINILRTIVRYAARWTLSAPYKTETGIKLSPVIILGSHTDTGSNIVDSI